MVACNGAVKRGADGFSARVRGPFPAMRSGVFRGLFSARFGRSDHAHLEMRLREVSRRSLPDTRFEARKRRTRGHGAGSHQGSGKRSLAHPVGRRPAGHGRGEGGEAIWFAGGEGRRPVPRRISTMSATAHSAGLSQVRRVPWGRSVGSSPRREVTCGFRRCWRCACRPSRRR